MAERRRIWRQIWRIRPGPGHAHALAQVKRFPNQCGLSERDGDRFFSTADQVSRAFSTEIHHLEVRGRKHIGNINNPQIPAALASVVSASSPCMTSGRTPNARNAERAAQVYV